MAYGKSIELFLVNGTAAVSYTHLPATLARDVKRMGELGYQVEKVAVVDQFCHSGHCESVCLLSKKKLD